jgi:hypothetical protein
LGDKTAVSAAICFMSSVAKLFHASVFSSPTLLVSGYVLRINLQCVEVANVPEEADVRHQFLFLVAVCSLNGY